MSLTRAAFTRICTKLPATTLHQQWGGLVAKVGGKVYALHGDTGGSIVFKVSELGFVGLTSLDGVTQAPYFAKGQWVAVAPDAALPAKDITAYIAASHRLIVAKLTRKLRAELGLG